MKQGLILFVLLYASGVLHAQQDKLSTMEWLFSREYENEHNAQRRFMEAFSTASRLRFDPANEFMQYYVSEERRKNPRKTDTAIVNNIIRKVIDKFLQDDFIRIEAGGNLLPGTDTSLKIYNNYICPCVTEKYNMLKEPGVDVDLPDLVNDCVGLMSKTAKAAEVQSELAKLSVSARFYVQNASGVYIYKECPVLRTVIYDACINAANNANRVYRNAATWTLNNKLEKAMMSGNIDSADLYFKNNKVRKAMLGEWAKAAADIEKLKNAEYVTDKTSGADNKSIVSTWVTNPGKPDAAIAFRMIYYIEWQYEKPVITYALYVPAKYITDGKEVMARLAAIEDTPPEIQELK